MKIPLYQSKWFGLNLEAIAKSCGHALSTVADNRIYAALYQHLLHQTEGLPSSEWLEKKKKLSSWLYKYLTEKKLTKASMLSLGSGLGIVEQPLIKDGLKIDLQECQSCSFNYLKKNYPQEYHRSKMIVSSDLSKIKSQHYDVIMAITSTYALNDEILSDFFNNVARIIKPEGIFILYETTLNWSEIRAYIKTQILHRKREGILWGWKRSASEFIRYARNHKLKINERYFFDCENNLMDPTHWLGICLGSKVAWQIMIFSHGQSSKNNRI